MDMSNMKTNMNIPPLKVKWTQTLRLNPQKMKIIATLSLSLWPRLGQGQKKKNRKQAKARNKPKHIGRMKKETLLQFLRWTLTLGLGSPKMFWIFGTKVQGVILVQIKIFFTIKKLLILDIETRLAISIESKKLKVMAAWRAKNHVMKDQIIPMEASNLTLDIFRWKLQFCS